MILPSCVGGDLAAPLCLKVDKTQTLLDKAIWELSQLLFVATSDDAKDYVSKKSCDNIGKLIKSMADEKTALDKHSLERVATKESLEAFFTRANEWLTTSSTTKKRIEGQYVAKPSIHRHLHSQPCMTWQPRQNRKSSLLVTDGGSNPRLTYFSRLMLRPETAGTFERERFLLTFQRNLSYVAFGADVLANR